jgi:hypothetical protein
MNGLAETGRLDARDSRNEMEKWRTQGERENGRTGGAFLQKADIVGM